MIINASGTYHLAEDVHGDLDIKANDVELDGMGNCIYGTITCKNVNNITLKNYKQVVYADKENYPAFYGINLTNITIDNVVCHVHAYPDLTKKYMTFTPYFFENCSVIINFKTIHMYFHWKYRPPSVKVLRSFEAEILSSLTGLVHFRKCRFIDPPRR